MDNLFGIGGSELVVIIILAGIVLGPERLARSAKEIGKFVRNVKAYLTSLSGELKAELDILDDIQKIKDDILK
ncbi:MAG: twin-arginine translocase TatA/TatE family subunit [Chloroflexota bacterium]